MAERPTRRRGQTRGSGGHRSLRVADERQALVVAIRPLVEAMGGSLIPVDEMTGSDVPISWEGEPVVAVRLPALHGVIDRLIARAELDLGHPLAELSREDKQRAVKLLDDLGAFTLRKGVEDVAAVLGVSRFTVYNYLNAASPES